MWLLEYLGLRTNIDRWCQGELIRSLGWGWVLLGTKSHLWITLTDGEDCHRGKKKKAEAKIQFYCALLRFVDLSQSMIPKFENLMVIPIIPSTCQSFLSFKKLYIQLYILCFHHWLLKGSFLLEKGCSWLSERIFSRKNLSAVSRNAAFSSQVYFIHA